LKLGAVGSDCTHSERGGITYLARPAIRNQRKVRSWERPIARHEATVLGDLNRERLEG
jgi:hypothetical protein